MANTPAQTFAEIQDIVKDLKKYEPTIKKEYEAATKELRKAIDDGSEDEITVSRPDLDKAVEWLDKGLDACDRLHVLTTALLPAKVFVAGKLKEVKDLIGYGAVHKKQLSTWATAARDLGKEADKALGLAKNDAKEIEAELGGLKNRAAKLQEAILPVKKDFTTLEKTAREATKNHDEKAAERARLAMMDEMTLPKRRLDEMKPILAKFKKDHTELDHDLKTELQYVQDTFDDVESTLKDGDKTVEDLIKLKQQTMAANKPEVEIAAMKVGVDGLRKDTDKFEDDIDKWRKICEDAAKSKNDKPAETARLALLTNVKALDTRAKRGRADFEKLKKTYPKLPPELAVQVTRIGDVLVTAEGSIKLGMSAFNEFIEMKKKAMAAKDEPQVVPKAELLKIAPLVPFDPKDADKMKLLTKIINTVPHEKWAEQFNKLFKVTTGKQIVLKIEKLPYFKKQLIDI